MLNNFKKFLLKFKFQINHNYFLKYKHAQNGMNGKEGHTYIKHFFTIYRTFKSN